MSCYLFRADGRTLAPMYRSTWLTLMTSGNSTRPSPWYLGSQEVLHEMNELPTFLGVALTHQEGETPALIRETHLVGGGAASGRCSSQSSRGRWKQHSLRKR